MMLLALFIKMCRISKLELKAQMATSALSRFGCQGKYPEDNMKGFSLLETIVAISILVLGILGPLAVATQALSRASITENEIIAYNLAEEGLEFIINKKESNSFSNISWLTGIDGSGGCHNASIPVSQEILEKLFDSFLFM